VKFALALLVALAGVACSDPAPARVDVTAAPDPNTVGTISGLVTVDGTVSPAAMVRLDADPKCAAMAEGGQRADESVVIGEGNTLRNVFVYVRTDCRRVCIRCRPRPWCSISSSAATSRACSASKSASNS
jgi:hypothetical protein